MKGDARASTRLAGIGLVCAILAGPAVGADATVDSHPAAGSAAAGKDAYPSTQYATVMDLARDLVDAGDDARADFAWIALDEMFTSYDREIIELEAQLSEAPPGRRNNRWMQATREYAAHLRTLADAITQQTAVKIRVEAPGLLQLEIDNALVVVSGPRIAEPDFMGQRIVERYCEIRQCGFAVASPWQKARAETAIDAVWSFSGRQGPVCVTDNGLKFEFATMSELGRKRSACIELAEQLNELARGLKRAAETGAFIDWEVLRVLSVAPGMPEQVTLNRQGDYLLLSVPWLGASRTLQRLALPWVKARVLGRPYVQSFPQAEHLLPESAPPG